VRNNILYRATKFNFYLQPHAVINGRSYSAYSSLHLSIAPRGTGGGVAASELLIRRVGCLWQCEITGGEIRRWLVTPSTPTLFLWPHTNICHPLQLSPVIASCIHSSEVSKRIAKNHTHTKTPSRRRQRTREERRLLHWGICTDFELLLTNLSRSIDLQNYK
jgi:hypothetical protein